MSENSPSPARRWTEAEILYFYRLAPIELIMEADAAIAAGEDPFVDDEGDDDEW